MDVIDCMKSSLNIIASKSVVNQHTMKKNDWLKQDPAQITLLVNMTNWSRNVEAAFANLKTNPKAMQGAFDDQVNGLSELIKLVQGDLEKPMRQKVMCLITIDAHSRDIIEKLEIEKSQSSDDFQWQAQLKVYFDTEKKDFFFRIADAKLWYGYEYLGNGPRLVVTPLTDRIYVTATQALHLKMGCAPAGPAGTGKTETTKDLANAVAKACYVFNCSDNMDYLGLAGIFKGLAASGSWGCFDEFNRLVPEVLSVCAVQFKAVLDAIIQGKKRFLLQGDEISLDPTCGAYITMNPGYLGRSELPEGLKALFRPITVVVPDLQLICENMLMAEGFIEAKALAIKFTTLYFLCRDLLSKAAHYDWGLRAIKSVLVVAGTFKRAEPHLPE
jgi:dynein heavy chain, axonemal